MHALALLVQVQVQEQTQKKLLSAFREYPASLNAHWSMLNCLLQIFSFQHANALHLISILKFSTLQFEKITVHNSGS